MSEKEFGFTNDEADFQAVTDFVASAVADGWEIEPTYGDMEPVNSAFRLRRDGFLLMGLNRRWSDRPHAKFKGEAKISGYGPDGMAIKVPRIYDGAVITAGVRRCNVCGAEDVDTKRYSFAGRACEKCITEAKRVHEYEGWTN